MNFPIEKQNEGSGTPPEMSPREKIEHAMSQVVFEVIQLRRTLWLVLKEVGRPVAVNETAAHPLWRMQATRLPDGQIQLEALQLLDPTEEQLAELAERLEGTRMNLEEAMRDSALKDHPPEYLKKVLAPRVIRRDDTGYWVKASYFVRNSDQTPENN